MIGAVSCGPAGIVVDGTSARGGKPVRVALSGRELQAYQGTRARKGTLLTPRMRPVALARPRAPAA